MKSINCKYGSFSLERQTDEMGNKYFNVYDSFTNSFCGELWGVDYLSLESKADIPEFAEAIELAFRNNQLFM